MSNKKVFVLGMARSGYEAAKLLVNKGYDVTVNDASEVQNKDEINELKALSVNVVLGSHPEELFDSTFEMLVKNPGISNNHFYVKKAQDFGIPVINELELGFRFFPQDVKIIGITGTNGKTTTTTIIYEFLKKASKRAFLMGNIGYPVCSFVPLLKKGNIAVMEVSDHQLCNVIDFKTDISILTNLSEAHLDFHGSYENYKNTKKRIFNHHTAADIAILNQNDEGVIKLTADINSSKKYFSSTEFLKSGCSINDGFIYYNNQKLIALSDIKIKGKHNYENVMAAVSAVKELHIADDVIIDVLKNFGGVEHRIEYVKTINNIEFYNDSKATNIKSTQIALSSFEKPTVLLLGGLDRGNSFDGLKEYLKNVKLIIAYGEAKPRIKSFSDENNIECKVVDTLEEATKTAYNSSTQGDVILLSPACASWDQFKNFEVRGDLFKEYISKLN